MSHWDYVKSQEISALDPSFDSLIMAALRKADSHNFNALKYSFPHIAQEMQARYNAPGGYIGEEVPQLHRAPESEGG